MNYGRFFRLNQSLSKVVDGVAIYDYVDLPAYFGPSENNPMSPKYPISLTITSNAICFRLHYSAFKIEEKEKSFRDRQEEAKKKNPKEKIKKHLEYAYDADDINKKSVSLKEYEDIFGVEMNMAHMEEVILELPYSDTISNRLSKTIKDIYNSTFPQVVDDNTSMGGRFLEQIIRKRYPSFKQKNESDVEGNEIEKQLYDELRKVSDDTISYSSLWLMDLYKGGLIDLYKIVKDEDSGEPKEIIIGFIRKLLLDFLFDLIHSDVFQNSANYQKMYSGLTSDFYFSSLIHKCEYYYYRRLTNQAITDYEIAKAILTDKEKKERTDVLKTLYATELVKAEELWIKDIINSQAEIDFAHKYPGKHIVMREFVEYYSFKQWPSWFAEPEEEMRRICFTMIDKSGESHICNADTLIEHLGVAKESDVTSLAMMASNARNREIVSRWFLKRYNFNDVIHLHLFKHLNVSLLLISLSFLLYFFYNESLELLNPKTYSDFKPFLMVLCFLTCPFLGNMFLSYASEKRWAVKTRLKLVYKRVCAITLFLLISFILFFVAEGYIDSIWTLCLYMFITCSIYFIFFRFFPYIHPISSLHLIFPRLVAAITAAWLTMSMGFDIYVSFFDSKPMWSTIIVISVIVFGFIMYELNRIMPSSSPMRKIYRSIEFLAISYIISLLVGLVVINFVGEKYLERGGYINDYFTQYVENKTDSTINRFDENGKLVINEDKPLSFVLDQELESYGKAIIMKIDSANEANNDIESFPKKLTKDLRNVYHSKVKDGEIVPDYRIARQIPFIGKKIFFLRDFLIMFSFIAMFWGIFIQMIFTSEKQMTEL